MIKIPEDLSSYRSVLCLDGDLPCDFLGKIDLPIVAADGAANTLIRKGIEPHIIIGDLDSVDGNLLRHRAHLKIASQDSTDFEKALRFIGEKSLAPTIVTGIDGGYIDHMLGNISIFSGTNFLAIAGDVMFMTVSGRKILDVPYNTKISIFGMPDCVINSKGLKWELNGERLSFTGKNSLGNRATSPRVELKISPGKAMIFVHAKPVVDAGGA